MTPKEHNSACAMPVPEKFSDRPAAHSRYGDDVAAEIAEVLRSAVTSTAAIGDVETSETNLQDHLDASVETLTSDQIDEQALEDDGAAHECHPEEMTEESPLDEYVEAYEPRPQVSGPEPYIGQANSARLPLDDENSFAPSRAVGFAAGLAASVAVGGGMLLLGIGMSEPPAAAVSEAPKFQSRLADISSAPVASVETAQPSEIAAAATIAEEAATAEEAEETTDTSPQQFARAVQIASRPDYLPLPTNPIYPAQIVGHQPDATPIMFQKALVSVPGVTFTDHRELTGHPTSSEPPEVAEFETRIEPAEAEQAIETDTETEEPERVAMASASSRTARVTMHVNMRAGPNTGQPVVSVVPGGSTVELIQCDHWCQVSFGGQQGWIYRDFINFSDSDAPTVD